MALIPRKTYPELTALTAPVVDGDVLAAYRSPGPLRRLTASAVADYITAATDGLITPEGSGERQTIGANINTARDWTAALSASQRDLLFNADPGDEPDITAELQAMLTGGYKTVAAPRGAHKARAKFTGLVLPEASYGRTLDFGGMTLLQNGASTGTQLDAGLWRPEFTSDIPAFGGFDRLRLMDLNIEATNEVHDALMFLTYLRNSTIERVSVKHRPANWTIVTPDHTTDTFTAADHGFVTGDYALITYASAGGANPTGIGPGSYRIFNATADTFQVSTNGVSATAFSSNGTGTIVAAFFGAWGFKIGGDDNDFVDLRVLADNPVIYQDGVHAVHGRRNRVTANVHCGDDAFAFGSEVSHTNVTDKIIEDWIVSGAGYSEMGHLFRAYTTASDRYVRRILADLTGYSGKLRNGMIGIGAFGAPDARTAATTIDKIDLRIDAQCGDPTLNQGVNNYIMDISGAANVKVRGSASCLGTMNGGTVSKSTGDLSGFVIEPTGGALAVTRSRMKLPTGAAGTADFITVQDSHVRLDGAVTGVPAGFAGIKRLAGSAFPSVISVGSQASIAHATGATTGAALDVSAVGFTTGQADMLSVEDGADFTGAVSVVSQPSSGNSGSVRIGDVLVKNQVRNSEAAGLVAGTGGTMPSGWAQPADPTSNLARTIVAGMGLVRGHQAVGIRMAGTTSGTAGWRIVPMGIGDAVAAQTQTWRVEVDASLLDLGTGLTNVTDIRLCIEERSAAGTLLATNSTVITLSKTAQTFGYQVALGNASTGRVTVAILATIANGVAVDTAVMAANFKLWKLAT